jgi:tight adherence protein B
MLLSMVAFFVAVGCVIGGYAAFAHLPAYLASRRLDERLREVSSQAFARPDATAGDTVVKREAEGPLPVVDRMLVGTRVGTKLEKLIRQAGSKTSPSSLLVASFGSALLAGALTLLIVRQSWAAPLVAVAAACAPFAWLRHRRSVRLKRFEEQFPEALDLLSRAIRAGHAFQTAMGMVADEVAAPVGPEFKYTFEQQNFGLPLRDALNAMPERIPLLDVQFFVTAVLIQRDTGGNLSEILDNLAHVVRERFKIRRQIRVHTAHGRFTGYVLLALPACLAAAMSMMNKEHMVPLFQERLGQMMLMGAIVLQTVGYFWIRKVIKIEV